MLFCTVILLPVPLMENVSSRPHETETWSKIILFPSAMVMASLPEVPPLTHATREMSVSNQYNGLRRKRKTSLRIYRTIATSALEKRPAISINCDAIPRRGLPQYGHPLRNHDSIGDLNHASDCKDHDAISRRNSITERSLLRNR